MKLSIIFILFILSLVLSPVRAGHNLPVRSCQQYQDDLAQLERYIMDLKLGAPNGESESIDLKEALKRRNELAAKLSIIQGLSMLRQRYTNFIVYLNNRPDPNFNTRPGATVWDNSTTFTKDFINSDALTGGLVIYLNEGETLYDMARPGEYMFHTGIQDLGNLVAMESTFNTLLGDATAIEQLKVAPPTDTNTPHPLIDTLIGKCGLPQSQEHLTSFCGLLTGSGPGATQTKQLIDRFARAFYHAHMARAIETDPALDPASEAVKSPAQKAADRALSDRARQALDEYHEILNADPISSLSATRDGRRVRGIDVIAKQFEGTKAFMTKYNQIYGTQTDCLNRIALSEGGSSNVAGWGQAPGSLNNKIDRIKNANTCALSSPQTQELTLAFQTMQSNIRTDLGVTDGTDTDDPIMLQQFKRLSVSRLINSGNVNLQLHQEQLGEWLQHWKKVKARPDQAVYGFYDDTNPVNYTDDKLSKHANDLRDALVTINNRAEIDDALRGGRKIDPSKLLASNSVKDDKTLFKLLLGQLIKYKNNFLPAELNSCPPPSLNVDRLNTMTEEELARVIHQCVKSLPTASDNDSITLKEKEIQAQLTSVEGLIAKFESASRPNYKVLQNVRKSLVNLAKLSCSSDASSEISTITCAVAPLNGEVQSVTYLIGSSGRILSRISPLDIVSDSSIPSLRNSIAYNCSTADDSFRPETATGAGPFTLRSNLRALCSAHAPERPVAVVTPVVAPVTVPQEGTGETSSYTPTTYTPSGDIYKWSAPLVTTSASVVPTFMPSTSYYPSSQWSTLSLSPMNLYTPGMGQFIPFTGMFSPTGYGMSGLSNTSYGAGFSLVGGL